MTPCYVTWRCRYTEAWTWRRRNWFDFATLRARLRSTSAPATTSSCGSSVTSATRDEASTPPTTPLTEVRQSLTVTPSHESFQTRGSKPISLSINQWIYIPQNYWKVSYALDYRVNILQTRFLNNVWTVRWKVEGFLRKAFQTVGPETKKWWLDKTKLKK